jgi:hypothetical protein
MLEMEEAQKILADYLGLLKAPEAKVVRKTTVLHKLNNKKKNRFNTDDESSEEEALEEEFDDEAYFQNEMEEIKEEAL